jgi:hypothetical protein
MGNLSHPDAASGGNPSAAREIGDVAKEKEGQMYGVVIVGRATTP